MLTFPQGNITFKSEEDSAQPADSSAVNKAASMLNVASSELNTALSQRVIAARGEVMQKTHTLTEAEYGRDAFAKVTVAVTFHGSVLLLPS